MSDAGISWGASETEPIEPFGISAHALDGCALRLRKSEKFHNAETRVVETDAFWDKFYPELKLEFDLEDLQKTTGLDADDVVVSVVIRDRNLNKFGKILEWPAWSLPAEPVELLPSWILFSHSDRVDICILATPAETRDRGVGIANHRADVVARTSFKIRMQVQATKIPHRWATPDEFVSRHVSPDTIWLINWLGEDLERPAAENVEIWFNEKFKDAFQVLDVGGEFANLFRREIAAAIFSDLALQAVSGSKPFVEEDGMRKMIYDLLTATSRMEIEQVFSRLEQPDAASVLHAWAQSYVGLNAAILKI